MAGSFNEASRPLYGGAVPFRSHQGLIPRVAARSDDILLQIDPVDGGLDHEVGGLHKQVAQEIDNGAKFQDGVLNKLLTLIKARAGAKNNVRRLSKSIVQNGSNHVIHIIVFALVCFFLVYLWYIISG